MNNEMIGSFYLSKTGEKFMVTAIIGNDAVIVFLLTGETKTVSISQIKSNTVSSRKNRNAINRNTKISIRNEFEESPDSKNKHKTIRAGR